MFYMTLLLLIMLWRLVISIIAFNTVCYPEYVQSEISKKWWELRRWSLIAICLMGTRFIIYNWTNRAGCSCSGGEKKYLTDFAKKPSWPFCKKYISCWTGFTGFSWLNLRVISFKLYGVNKRISSSNQLVCSLSQHETNCAFIPQSLVLFFSWKCMAGVHFYLINP